MSSKQAAERLEVLRREMRDEAVASPGLAFRRSDLLKTTERSLTEYGTPMKGLEGGIKTKISITILAGLGPVVVAHQVNLTSEPEAVVPFALISLLSFGPIIAAAWSPSLAAGVRITLGVFLGLVTSITTGLIVNLLSLPEPDEPPFVVQLALQTAAFLLTLMAIVWLLLMFLEWRDKQEVSRSTRCRSNLSLILPIDSAPCSVLLQVDRSKRSFKDQTDTERRMRLIRRRFVFKWVLLPVLVLLLVNATASTHEVPKEAGAAKTRFEPRSNPVSEEESCRGLPRGVNTLVDDFCQVSPGDYPSTGS